MEGVSISGIEVKFVEKFHYKVANFGNIFVFQNLSKVEVTLQTFPSSSKLLTIFH